MQHRPILLARKLRKESTDAEKKLWQQLRCRQLGGLRFRRQVPLGSYIVDFACFDPRIVIEVDGGQHAEEVSIQYDHKRTIWLKSCGYTVLRFWNDQVLEAIDEVTEEILRTIEVIIFPHPHLPPEGEGV